MKQKLTLLSLLALFAVQSHATSVKGVSTAYSNKTIKVVRYLDAFCQKEIIVKEQTIGADGRFNFDLELGETQYISLRIGNYKASFYVEPEAMYELSISAFDETSSPPLGQDKILSFDFVQQDEDSLNYKILAVNQALAKFQSEYYTAYLQNQVKQFLPTLERYLSKIKSKSLYLSHYKSFIIGRQSMFASTPKRDIFDKYLANEIHYHNLAYTEMFTDFYSKWFSTYLANEDRSLLNRSIQNNQLDSLKMLLQRNDFLKNEEIAELVLVQEIYRLGAQKSGSAKQPYISLLENLQASSEIEHIQESSAYYLDKLQKLTLGKEVPSFDFRDQFDNVLNLEKYRGKHIYLGFWSPQCETCIKSMVVLNHIYAQHKDSIEFISVAVNCSEDEFEVFIKNQPYSWTFAFVENQKKLIEDFQVKALPLYYLIDAGGRLVESPAKEPGSGIELKLESMFSSKSDGKNEIWNWNQQKPGDNK